MAIREGACCVQPGHTRTRRDRCPARSVQDRKEEKSPRSSALGTCPSVGVRRVFKDALLSVHALSFVSELPAGIKSTDWWETVVASLRFKLNGIMAVLFHNLNMEYSAKYQR